MLFRKMRKRYWKKIIIYGKGVPHTCDGMMPIPEKVKSLYSDEEWTAILEERKKYEQELRSFIDDLDK